MKVRDIVMIYEDPLTCRKPEGKAKLLKLLKDDIELQFWRVCFDNGETANRWIKKKEDETK